MNFVALRMLTGDRAKYVGLIFAIAFSTFLLENQSSIFAGMSITTYSGHSPSSDNLGLSSPGSQKPPIYETH
jgi:hypothetical protein